MQHRRGKAGRRDAEETAQKERADIHRTCRARHDIIRVTVLGRNNI